MPTILNTEPIVGHWAALGLGLMAANIRTEVGITHVFVNWGSDHPAMLEELERQRETNGSHALTIVTSPNEMVALSAAQGYAQVTGKPAAVIVHVDVGTQALAGAVHNADRGRAPVLIYAGASPFTTDGELKGSRNEWNHWFQDVHDQPAIVRQYMRYTAQISSPANLPHVVRRALQIATSEPKGPVYLWGRREVMEQEIDQSLMERPITLAKWPSVEPTALPSTATRRIASALLAAKSPLLITSHLGRNHAACQELVSLSLLLALPIFLTCPSAINVPASHPYLVGSSYLVTGTHTPLLKSADVILVIDANIAWFPMNKDKDGAHERPNDTAQVFVIDSGDPLKRGIGMHHEEADLVCQADAAVALAQIQGAVTAVADGVAFAPHERAERIRKMHDSWLAQLRDAESVPLSLSSSGRPAPYTTPQIVGALRTAIQASGVSREGALVLNEALSNYDLVCSHMQPEISGEMIFSGGSSLGWALGGGIGAVLGGRVAKKGKGTEYELVTSIVGDGTFLFCVPASAFWMARRYQTPFLTIVLNNGGWKSPKLSMLRIHPQGPGSRAVGDQLTVGFGPDCPDYSQIAVAASSGWAMGTQNKCRPRGGRKECAGVVGGDD
ncbi:thiamine pyrophosphate enzyme, N-terminal TPP binding domain-containing protein [Melanogaster broomeanus]|nr:thiamine pyrophosphate enzyme, N-terminal TPP binding domain-containing protein [Melanogaster broomeanus]